MVFISFRFLLFITLLILCNSITNGIYYFPYVFNFVAEIAEKKIERKWLRGLLGIQQPDVGPSE